MKIEEEERYDKVVEEVVKRLAENDLYVKPEKYKWKVREVGFSGVVIGLEGIKMEKKKIKEVYQAQFTLGWKSAEWTRRWVDLWNDLGFSLCAAPSVCRMVATSDKGEKVWVEVSTDWCVAVEHQRSSSIRGYLHRLSD